MKSQKILTIFASLFLFIFAVSFTSALSISAPSDLTRNNNQTSIILTASENLTNIALTFNPNPLIDGSATLTFSTSDNNFNLNSGSSKTLNILTDFSSESFSFGKHTTTLTASGTNSTGSAVSATKTVTHLSSFCKSGTKGDLEIRNVDLNNEGDGGDEDWKLLDSVTIEVEVKNIGSDDIDDIFVEIGFFNSDGENVVDDFDFENTDEEEFDIGKIKDGDKETVEFKFKVPADFEDGTYMLAVKVYSDDLGEENACADTASDLDNDHFQSIDIEREDDEGKFIGFDKITFKPQEATCGDTVTLTADVFNVGDEDQDQVKVNLLSSSLNVDLSKEIRNDLDQGDKESVSFAFVIPQNAENKAHRFDLTSDYDYRSSSNTYRESSDEETSVTLNVIGCTSQGDSTGQQTGKASITATLDSEARIGEELVIKATIKNPQSATASFVIDAAGYESWATLNLISQRLVSLNAGEEKEVILRFTPTQSGQQSFAITAQSGSNFESRDVIVNIQPKAGFLTGAAIGSGNTLIWTIGIINVVLIILIIIVAVSLSRR